MEDRFAEAALGLRPSIRSKPARRKSQTPSQIIAPKESFDKQVAGLDGASSDGLGGLGLTTRQMMILHSMHIKTLQDFLLATDASLSKHLTKTVIATLRDRARRLEGRYS